MKKLLILFYSLLCFGTEKGRAQYTVLHNFGSFTKDGTSPFGEVTPSGNKLYGMAWGGGANGEGTVFSMNTNGNNYTDMLDFDWTGNGAYPIGSFILYGKVLYGMTLKGGSNGIGTIFSIDTNGYNDIVYLSFNNNLTPFGAVPYGDLIITGNKLYGMTAAGGIPNDGIIFSIDTNGNGYRILHNFNRTLGAGPLGSLILSGSMLYGMTRIGGASDSGCIFSIDTNGNRFADILDFNSANGGYPQGSLILSGNRLYGMTALGGLYGSGCIFSLDTNGSGYKKLLDFNGTNGAKPDGSLILSGGFLYGMAYSGGLYDSGCIFSIDTNGSGYKDLFDFNNLNGTNPMGSLTLVGNTFYGMAYSGGLHKAGVIFTFTDTSITTGINKINAVSEMNVFPNPSKGSFTLSLSNVNEKCNVEIYNEMGQKVTFGMLKQVQHDYALDLSAQPNGVYFYRVIKESGGLVGSGKVVIEK